MLLIYYSILGIHVLHAYTSYRSSCLLFSLHLFCSISWFVFLWPSLLAATQSYFLRKFQKSPFFWSQQLVRSQYFLLYQTSLLRLSSRIFLTLSLITFQLPSPYTAFIQPLSLLWFLLPALLSEQSTQHVMFLPSFPDRLEAVTLFYITFLSCYINN